MATVSGKHGTVKIGSSDVRELTNWSGSFNPNNQAWNSNQTGGAKRRIAGVLDSSGSMAGKFDESDPIWNSFEEGDEVTLHLYVCQNPPRYRVQPAVIGEVQYEVDIDDGAIVGWTANWEGNGPGYWVGSP